MQTHNTHIGPKLARQVGNWFWALVILAIAGYLALVLIGAYVPWEVLGATVLFVALVAIWGVHALVMQRHRDEVERDPRLRRARERRGF
jgi:hypothetical protein